MPKGKSHKIKITNLNIQPPIKSCDNSCCLNYRLVQCHPRTNCAKCGWPLEARQSIPLFDENAQASTSYAPEQTRPLEYGLPEVLPSDQPSSNPQIQSLASQTSGHQYPSPQTAQLAGQDCNGRSMTRSPGLTTHECDEDSEDEEEWINDRQALCDRDPRTRHRPRPLRTCGCKKDDDEGVPDNWYDHAESSDEGEVLDTWYDYVESDHSKSESFSEPSEGHVISKEGINREVEVNLPQDTQNIEQWTFDWCFKCHSFGHWADTCERAARVKSWSFRKLVRIENNIDGSPKLPNTVMTLFVEIAGLSNLLVEFDVFVQFRDEAQRLALDHIQEVVDRGSDDDLQSVADELYMHLTRGNKYADRLRRIYIKAARQTWALLKRSCHTDASRFVKDCLIPGDWDHHSRASQLSIIYKIMELRRQQGRGECGISEEAVKQLHQDLQDGIREYRWKMLQLLISSVELQKQNLLKNTSMAKRPWFWVQPFVSKDGRFVPELLFCLEDAFFVDFNAPSCADDADQQQNGVEAMSFDGFDGKSSDMSRGEFDDWVVLRFGHRVLAR